MKVFVSGSCRLMASINNGHNKIIPIHSFYPLYTHYTGVNFLGKLFNIKQHIQFIKWINDEIELSEYILKSFLLSFSEFACDSKKLDDKSLIPIKKHNIKESYNTCDYYMFEISSLKIYEKNRYQVLDRLTQDYQYNLQSEEDLYNDLVILYNLIPKDKPIIFQCHFRPNIIYKDESKAIINREIIYNVLNKFCSSNSNSYLYDPSILLNINPSLFDSDVHFNHIGYTMNFKYIYEKYIQKSDINASEILKNNKQIYSNKILNKKLLMLKN